MAVNLAPASIPLLSPDAALTNLEGGNFLLETPDAEYTFEGDSARVLATVADRLDGSAPLSTLAATAGVSPSSLIAVLAPLAEDDLLFDARAMIEGASSEDFLRDYHRLCRFWARELGLLPFWSTMASGRASRSLVLGWGIEFYHYVESANEHMSASVAYCRTDPAARQWFAQHYVEEHDHSAMFLDGLVASGLDREQVKRAPPLGTTRALINYLVELATTDSLAYAGAFGMMRDSKESAAGTHAYHEMLMGHYGFARGLFEAVLKHAHTDMDLNHDALVLDRMVGREERVSPEAARRILAGARGMLEHFILYFEGIHDTYGVPTAPVPRRAVDARTLIR